MDNSTLRPAFLYNDAATPAPVTDTPVRLEQLLGTLEEVVQSAANPRAREELEFQQKLLEQRLGIASGLFAALRVKHPPTAAHSIRVGIGCSSWAEKLKLPENERNELEIAALLHDVGKIGVPDRVLGKTSSLDTEELLEIGRAHV